jgi:hypothetical protein
VQKPTAYQERVSGRFAETLGSYFSGEKKDATFHMAQAAIIFISKAFSAPSSFKHV